MLPLPEACVEDVDEAAEESFEPLELMPEEEQLLLDMAPLDDVLLVLLLLFADGIADAPPAMLGR